MQFSENWLRTMVDPKMTSDELAHLLTMSGLEVEEIAPVAPPFTNVVVAKVLTLAKHPNADRLNVCEVDAGTGTLLNIVCGAPNVRAGMKVVCAMAGADRQVNTSAAARPRRARELAGGAAAAGGRGFGFVVGERIGHNMARFAKESSPLDGALHQNRAAIGRVDLAADII